MLLDAYRISIRHDIQRVKLGSKQKNEEIHILKSWVHSGEMEASPCFEIFQKALKNYKFVQFGPFLPGV
jgi:hypothetical protein